MEKFNPESLIKMDPELMEEILKENPEIRQDEEYFLIETESQKGKQTHCVPKRNYMNIKTENNGIIAIPTKKIIKAIKKYPDKPLNESLKLIEKED